MEPRLKAFFKNPAALMDLLLAAVILVAAYILFVDFEALSLAYSYIRNSRIAVIDEFAVTAIVLMASLGVLAIRRSMKLRRELEARSSTEEELARSRRELESIVQEHTADLSEANERLREQMEETRSAREELKREKGFSDSVINSLPGVFYLFDENGNFQRWNRGFEAVSGYSAQEISRMSPLDLFEGQDRDLIAERIERALETGEATAEAYLTSKNKDRTPYYFTGRGVNIGGKTYCCGLGIDITEQKLAQEALGESEERYRAIFEGASEGILLADIETRRFEHANPQIARMLGHSPGELADMSVDDIHPRETAAAVIELFERGARGEINLAQDVPCLKKDGSVIYADINCAKIRLEGRDYLAGFFTDVTGRKKAQEALEISERNYREIFNASIDALMIQDAETGAILDVNRALCEESGYTREEILNMSVEELSKREPPYTDYTVRRRVQRAMREGPQTFEWEAKTKSGELIWVEVNLKHATIGGESRILAVSRNITGRKEAEEALRESEEKYRHLSEASFEAILIHEGGVLIDANEQYFEMFGYEPHELLGKQSIPLTVAPESLGHLKMQVASGVTEPYEAMGMRKDGSVFPMELRARHMNYRGKNVRFTAIRDLTERKEAEEALRESRTLLHSAMESLPFDFFAFDEDGRYILQNSLNRERWGDLTGRCLEDMNVETRYKSVWQEANLRALSGETVRGEFPYRQNGEEAFFYSIISPIKDGEKITGALGVNIDITERKLAEEETRRSRENLQTVLDSMPFGVFMVGEDKKIIQANQAALDTLGYESEDELLGKDCHRVICPAYEGRCPIYDFGEEIDRSERFLKTSDGGEVPVLKSVISMEIEGREVLLETFVDITERRRALEALRESEEKYRQVVDHANDAIFIVQDGAIKFPNPKTLELSGYTEEELAGLPFLELVHPEFRDMVAERHQKRLEGHEVPDTYSIRAVNKAKEELWVEVGSMSINWEGRPATLSFLRDVTPQKRLEDQLRQAQKMEAIGTLAGGIAHDFNNILGAIIGYAELMEMFDVPEDTPLRASLDEVLRAGNRAKELVKQILTFSRQTEQEHRPLSLSTIIKEALRFLRASLPATVEIRQNIEERGSPVLADPTQMHQVLINLCTNAAHAMRDEGGTLWVGTEDVELGPEDASRFMDLAPGPYVRLSVSDTGRGISHEVMDRIFDPYFTTKRPGEGTGMGLAVVHGIVKSHRGEVEVESEVGGGTTFAVYLPACRGGPEDFREETREVCYGGGERIMFVDDEEPLVRWAGKALGQLGYEVVGLTDGREALEVFGLEPAGFDLVVTDLTMPHMTGLELAEELLKVRPDLPVVLSTGFSEKITRENAEALGIKEYIMKPTGTREIAEVVHRALHKD